MRRAASLALAGLALVACARPSPPPTPAPTATAAAEPTVDADAADVQDAFLSNVSDLTSEIEELARAQCEDLTVETRNNPNEVPQIHGFAATLKRIGSQQAALNTEEVRLALAGLDAAVGHLDGALSACGITPP